MANDFDDEEFLFLDDDDFQPKVATPAPKPEPKPEPPKPEPPKGEPKPEARPEVPKTTRPQVDTCDEEVLEQGTGYKGEEAATKETKPVRERPTRERPTREAKEPKEKKEPRESKVTPKMMGIAIASIAALVLILIVGSSFNKKAKEKAAAEEQARLDAIMNEEIEQSYFSYSREEVEALRLAGYTGYEIEEFQLNEINAQSKVDEANAIRQRQLEEEMKPYFQGASDKFMEMWNKTWVGQDEFTVSTDLDSYNSYSVTLNLDYEKVGSTGYQCWLRVWLTEDTYFFIYVSPVRWNQLTDTGNIVLEIYYTNIGEEQKSVITGWQEIIN